MSWRKQMRVWTIRSTRKAGEYTHRVAVHGLERARQAGRVAAHKILSVQMAARMPERIVRKSAVSVTERPAARASDAAWQQGYEHMVRARIPGLLPARQPEPDMEAGG
jgi:hypothetical protein